MASITIVHLHCAQPAWCAHLDLRLFTPSLQAAVAQLPGYVLLEVEPHRLALYVPFGTVPATCAERVSAQWQHVLGAAHPLVQLEQRLGGESAPLLAAAPDRVSLDPELAGFYD